MNRALGYFFAISLLITSCNELGQQAAQKTDTITALPAKQYCTTGITQRLAVSAGDSIVKKGKSDTTTTMVQPQSNQIK